MDKAAGIEKGLIMGAVDNLLGLADAARLAREEERLTKKRAMEIWDRGILDDMKPGSVETLLRIHGYLFQDVYGFAGIIRTVDIAKGGFQFALARFLDSQLDNINSMPDSSWEEIVDKYIELNVAHPFREGNGRSGRIWLDHLTGHRLNQHIKWADISRRDYMDAMARSHVTSADLNTLLSSNLVDGTISREVFADGLDGSYKFEGFSEYKAVSL